MPAKKGTKLAEFISRGDQQALGDLPDRHRRELLEGAKIQVPKGFSNIRQTRSRSSTRKQTGAGECPASNLDLATGERHESKGGFFDTDASSIDQTSTASSNHQHTRDDGYLRRLESELNSHGDPDVKPKARVEDEVIDCDNFDIPEHVKRDDPQQLEDRSDMPGMNLGYLKNDSYPNTTSGNPSVVDVTNEERSDVAAARRDAAPPTRYTTIPTRGTGTRLNLHSRDAPRVDNRQMHIPVVTHVQQAPSVAAQTADPAIPADFWASNQPKHRKLLAQPPANPQNSQLHLKADAETLANTSQREATRRHFTETAKRSVPQHDFEGRGQQVSSNVAKFRQQGPQHSHDVRYEAVSTQSYETRQRGQQPTLEESANHFNIYADRPNLAEQPAFIPEHPLEELYALQFDELRSQPFDHDPNGEEFEIEGEDQSLGARLTAVMAQDNVDDRSSFYRSLALEEWEEAGDWFLERFADTVRQLRTARRAKRQVAREFEEEIARRHDAVAKRRKLITHALDEMRASGDRVLQATPAKGRKVN